MKDIEKEQLVATKIVNNSIIKNKISHAYLISGNGYKHKLDFAKYFAKKILTKDLGDNLKENIIHRIDNNIYTELKIIEADGNWIKKEQLIQLQQEFSQKPVEGEFKIYIINDCEKLNSSSANSILKFLEEPADGIIAILVTNNYYQVINTIRSRCQNINLINKLKEADETDKINFKYNYVSLYNVNNYETNEIQFEELKNDVDLVEKFIINYEINNKSAFLNMSENWNVYFNDKEKVLNGLNIMLMLYKLMLDHKNGKYLFLTDDLFKLNIDQNILIKKIKIIISKKNQLNFNMNINLLMDKLIIEFLEVEDDRSS